MCNCYIKYINFKDSGQGDFNQASKKTDFTVDLIWWSSLKACPNNYITKYKKVWQTEMD